MEYVNIFDDIKIGCSKDGNQYTYSFIDSDGSFNKLHRKSPLEHTKNSEIGKKIFEYVNKEPVSATSEDERKSIYQRKFDNILQSLQDLLDSAHFEEEKLQKQELKNLQDSYENAYESFKMSCRRYNYSPLQYLVRVFEGYGVNSTLEIFKAYLGYLQTLIGLRGTNVIAIGSQSSGKSHIVENPLDCIPQEYVHRGTYTLASFFTEFAGRDLTHHLFYLGDLGGINDDSRTIEFRDIIKQLSTDGYISRNYKEDGEVITETITGYPALVYTTVNEEMINEQEKSRSIIIMPPNVDQWLLMIYDSFNEAPACDFQLKLDIEDSKRQVIGYSWFLMNNFENVELYNPYMFAVQEYLTNIDDFNRKIKEFNMLLKLVTVLNGGFCMEHNLYYDVDTEETIITRLMIASKKDVVDALNLFEGSSGLLPTEIALLKGLLENYVCYSDVMDIDYNESDEFSFEEAVHNFNWVDDVRIGNDDFVDLHYVKVVTDKGDTFPIINWDNSYKYYNTDVDDYENCYVWFTVSKIRQVFKNARWYRNVNKSLSEKLLKLHEYGMIIKIGKTVDGANIYGLNYGIDDLINNIEPNWNKSAINRGIQEFHRKYPSLTDEFDEFIREDRKSNIKYTDMEIRDGGLYNLPWRGI
ncbi:hypothetical protein [Methanobrevibacter sp.]